MKLTFAALTALLLAAALVAYCSMDGDTDDLLVDAHETLDPAPELRGSRRVGPAPRESVAATENASSKVAAVTGGIWFEGVVRAPGSRGEPVRIEAWNSRPTDRAQGRTSADGRLAMIVTRLLEGDERSSCILQARFTHSDHLEKLVTVLIENRTVHAGMNGTKVVIPIDLTLEPVTRRVKGVVRVPNGRSTEGVRIVLLESVLEGGVPHLIDETTPRNDGSFELEGRIERSCHVVAWLDKGGRLLRPTTRHLPAYFRDARGVTLRLNEGSQLAGRVAHDGQLAEVGLLLFAKLDFDSVPEDEETARLIESSENTEEEITDLSWDDLIPPKAPPNRVNPPEVLEGPRRFVELEFAAGNFEFPRVCIGVKPDGSFSTKGLRPGTRYEMGRASLTFEGTEVPFPEATKTWGEAVTPDSRVLIRFPTHLFLLEASASGKPLAHTVLRIEPPRKQAVTDSRGRVVFAAPSATENEMLVRSMRHKSKRLKLRVDRWQKIEFEKR